MIIVIIVVNIQFSCNKLSLYLVLFFHENSSFYSSLRLIETIILFLIQSAAFSILVKVVSQLVYIDFKMLQSIDLFMHLIFCVEHVANFVRGQLLAVALSAKFFLVALAKSHLSVSTNMSLVKLEWCTRCQPCYTFELGK